MSDSDPTSVQILLNGEKHNKQQNEVPCGDPKEEHTSSAILDDECMAENDTQEKMQSILEQVRRHIRSQRGLRAPKSSILELVQKICEKEAENTGISDFAPSPLQILLNGERHNQQPDEVPHESPKEDHTWTGQSASLANDCPADECPADECTADECMADKDAQVKMQSILQQVRKQIRSQGGVKAPKSSILELVQKFCEKDVVNGEVDNGSSDVEKEAEMLIDSAHQTEEDLCTLFEKKLEASERALREEFGDQIMQLRKEMQAYTEHVLKDLECKIQSPHNVVPSPNDVTSPKNQPKQSLDKKLPACAAPSVVLRRGRVLTRTMTTIIPKTCTPVIISQRAKSETLSSSKTRLVKEPMLTSTAANYKSYQNRRPLPPAGPRQPKRPLPPKVKTGK